MLALYVTCRRCQQEFRSGVFVSEEISEGLALQGMLHHCTLCGAPAWYFTDDYHPSVETSRRRSASVVGDARIGAAPRDVTPETFERRWPPSWRSVLGQRRPPLSLHP